ncbi:hypothetical protein O181_126754 [Austropuccinia psidii MF-1]|uniref:Uncharacterized protein n=1 Tax=Austropuccinia psidii MF-1 TaxID=1389203 RepID=A0A9Q3KTZ8_9BASI|nr:hypothetical protein [Austropuccinia psidii MF-1]
MPEPQITEGGSTEGDNSVSSWAITQLWPPTEASKKMKILVPLDFNHYPGPPHQHCGGQVLDGPGPSQWAQAMWWKIGLWAIMLVPWTPWKPGIFGPRGPSIASMDHGP